MQTLITDTNEPEIEELLADPILLAVLERDGLTVEDIWDVVSLYRSQNDAEPVSFN